MLRKLLLSTLLGSLSLAACGASSVAEPVAAIPAPAFDPRESASATQKAVLAGGCFWGVQGVYQHLKGVKNVLSGYAGGDGSTASYRRVSQGDTGHAESVEILYDPAQVSYGQILQVFFAVAHDPTQLDRQGPDVGTQYRSAIFYADQQQKEVAEAYIAQLGASGAFPRRIVTRVDPLKGFFRAEDYHQDYLLNHPDQPYIAIHDLPKVRNFERLLPALYRAQPVTVAESAGASGRRIGANAPVNEGELPELEGATGWLNSAPLTSASLRGKVVLVDFWTYSCVNCQRTLPYVNAWYRHYKDSGLVVIGVHSPEFGFEKREANVRGAIARLGVKHPVVLDNDFAIWKRFNNRYWPAIYFVDAQGRIRGHHFGEGRYAQSESTIRQLLLEAGARDLPVPLDDAAERIASIQENAWKI